MSYVTVEVQIESGRVIPRGTEKLPEKANGLLTILPAKDSDPNGQSSKRESVRLPIICGDGKRIINPTAAELDASFWGD